MQIRANGLLRDLPAGTTVAALLAESSFTVGTCAVAVNLDFVPRSSYAATVLREGDEVEIVMPRQGG